MPINYTVNHTALKNIIWRDDFLGIGYRYHDVYMNVFPIFEDKRYASKFMGQNRTMVAGRRDQIKVCGSQIRKQLLVYSLQYRAAYG